MNLFDELIKYSKITFSLLRKRKVIFVPYVALLVLKILVFLFLFRFGVHIIEDFIRGGLKPEFIYGYPFLSKAILSGAVIGLIYLLISSYINAGISSMYFLALKGHSLTLKDFWAGANYFFRRFFGGNLILIIGGTLLSPLLVIAYITVGVLTLGLGFLAVPLLVAVFLGMWQVSLVCNDTNFITSIKNSYRFGKDYFWPLLLVNFIQGVTSTLTSLGGGSGKESGTSYKVNPQDLDKIPSYFLKEGLSWLIGLGSAVFGLIFIASSLFKLVLDTFFKGLYFVVYLDKRA